MVQWHVGAKNKLTESVFTMSPKYSAGQVLRMYTDDRQMHVDLRITEVRSFPPRILYSFAVENKEEAQWPFEGAAYFESELDRFGVELLEGAFKVVV